MDVAVTGASGLIGSALVDRLRAGGHRVRRLVRPGADLGPGDVRWDPTTGDVDLAGLSGVTGVVHLAGAGVGDHRWTERYRQEIRQSRVDGTRTLVAAMRQLDPQPKVLVSGSAVGWYGDRGDEVLTESSGPGDGFLAEVAQTWEDEALRLADSGIRVATIRSGIVLARGGGALGPLLRVIKLGLGGPLGSGRQWWSWISLEDEVRAIEFVLGGDLAGPVNLTAPDAQRQADLVHVLARAAHRPSLLPAPAFAIRAALGPMADDMVLGGQRVLPGQLDRAGFEFVHDDIHAAAAWLLRRS